MIATGTALAIAGGMAVAGGTAAGLSQKGKVDYNSDKINGYISQMGATKAGTSGLSAQQSALEDTRSISSGSTAQGLFGAQDDLAGLLKQYQSTGGLPSGADLSAGNEFAANQFQSQRVSLQQTFQDQLRSANQQAALSGRSINDPILRAKLAQEQSRQSSVLDAQQGALAGQTAFGLSDKRLQYAEGRTNVLGQQLQSKLGMAQNMFTMGQGIQGGEINQYQSELQRLQLQSQTTLGVQQLQMGADKHNADRGGGIGDIMKGAIGGVGAGMSAISSFGGMGGGGGAGMSTGMLPAAPAGSSNMFGVSNFSSFGQR